MSSAKTTTGIATAVLVAAFAVLMFAVTLTVPAIAAGAAERSTILRMYGDVRPRHWNWALEAQKNVPLPAARITLSSGYDPLFYPSPVGGEIYLPQPGVGGWTYWDERVLLVHELGHAFDFGHLDRAERNQFRSAIHTTCSWFSARCYLPGYPRTEAYLVPPVERFAEMYGACALGMTVAERDGVPSVSYGWYPPEGTDAALCALIRSFAD